jgi:extracellular factor (EF) 3-hydroxypalmitic acid methyl ester biosynthesis protein
VRSRTEQIAHALAAHCLRTEEATFHVVSVGSGPANDIRLAISLLPEKHRVRLCVTLLELDPEALAFARQQVEPLLLPGSTQCIRENLYRLPRAQHPEQILGTPDFLVCSGLFDYLHDEAAAEMQRLFWQRLRANGLLLVGNFAPHNPTRAYMEWIGNWYLTYRTAEDLERLALQSGIPASQFTIASEPLGVDLFLVARK